MKINMVKLSEKEMGEISGGGAQNYLTYTTEALFTGRAGNGPGMLGFGLLGIYKMISDVIGRL